MKKSTLKKAFAFMLALVLAFAMAVPAFAATAGDDYTITITPNDYTDTSVAGRYKAYEIFTGDLTASASTDDEKNQLSNIKWGADIDVTSFVEALAADEEGVFSNAFDGVDEISDPDLQAATVAKILDNNRTNEAFVKAFAVLAQKNLKPACQANSDDSATDDTNSHPVSSKYENDEFTIGLEKSGYYLVVDEYSGEGDQNIISEHMLQVVRDREINVKSGSPSVTKDIVTRNGKGEYEIGEKITFQLVGTLAENFKNFLGDYYYAFKDTMSDGLTLDQSSIKVEVWSVKSDGTLDQKQNITLTQKTDATGDYTVTVTGGNGSETNITIAFDNLKDIQNLLATHVIVVTYDAYINGNAVIGDPETNEVYVEFSNDPYDEDGESTTTTPEDEVEVQTFELDIVKKDAVSNNPLSGVKFKLYKEASPSNVYGKFTGSAGSYTVDTTDAPFEAWTAAKTDGTELVTGTDGKLNIKGLAPGTYYLEEVETPNGYNALPGPIKIEITATYYTAEEAQASEGQHKEGDLKSVTATYTINGKTSALAIPGTASNTLGIVTLEVLNVPTSTLPTTGGIGNYIFYIGGGVLLIVAAMAFILVSKKKTVRG